MSLVTAATVTLGSSIYGSHAAEITVNLALLPGTNQATVRLPAGVRLAAAPGDPGIVALDGGEAAETVLTGVVRSMRRDLSGVAVSIADAGTELARLRPATTYFRQNAQDIIRALADASDVDLGSIEADLSLAAYVAHQHRTAAEHIAALSHLAGAVAFVAADGTLQVTARPGSQPDRALRYGREIVDYCAHQERAPAAQRIPIGSGPAGAADAPEALRPSLHGLPDNAPAPGRKATWEPAPILRTPKAHQTAAAALSAAGAAGAARVVATCFLQPALRPGMVVEVQDLPNSIPGGPWLIIRVCHRLKPTVGGSTVFVGETAAASPDSLLNAALGAVGGLL